jgi:hypothetical protein
MSSKEITVPDLGTVTLHKRKGNHNIRLSVTADGNVRVSLPPWLPYQAGITFAISKASWIESQRQHAVRVLLKNQQSIGKAHHLYLEPSASVSNISSRLKSTQAKVTYPTELSETNPKVQKAARLVAIRALRSEAETLLPKRLNTLAAQGNFTYKNVQIKQLKRRWGSCNQSKEIVLNLFLMQLPWQIIDYVILHELAHTKHLHHGAKFWEELISHVPNAKDLKRQMREFNTDIMSL